MTSTTPLPTLFGRFTAILSEHKRLGVTLRRLRDMCAALEVDGRELGHELQPVPLIADLQGDLSLHFAAEEADAYFGTVVQERPSLLPNIAELESEHAAMLEAIARLGAIAADNRRWKELRAPVLHLIEKFRAHEHTETVLLQEFLLRDEAANEDPGAGD